MAIEVPFYPTWVSAFYAFGSAASNINIDASPSANMAACAFIALGQQVSRVRLWVDSISGSLPSGTFGVDICPAASGNSFLPDHSNPVASGTNTSTLSGTTGTQVEITNFSSHSLTVGQRYWLVFKNLHGTPASNYPSFTPIAFEQWQYSTLWHHAAATWNGSAWSYNGTNRVLGTPYVEFSNGSKWGGTSDATGISDGLTIYGTSRLSGVRITVPARIWLGLIGVSFQGGRNGSGCTIRPLVYKQGSSTPEATGLPIPPGALSGIAPRVHLFADKVTLLPGTTYYIVLGNPDNDGSSSNNYRLTNRVSVAYYGADSPPLDMAYAESSNGGSSWSTSTTVLPRVGLMFDRFPITAVSFPPFGVAVFR